MTASIVQHMRDSQGYLYCYGDSVAEAFDALVDYVRQFDLGEDLVDLRLDVAEEVVLVAAFDNDLERIFRDE